MPQPYLIGDERAMSDFMTNPASNPVFAVSGLENQQNGIVAATAAISSTETIVAQRTIEPGATLLPGSLLRFNLFGTSTSTVANTTTFNIYIGPNGTTSDTKVVTFTTAAAGTTGTNVTFRLTGDVVVRTIGATATAYYVFVLSPSAATAIGGSATAVFFNGTQNATFSTITGLWISISCVNAASTTAETFQTAYIEVLP